MNNLWSACALTVCDYLQCAPSVPFHECSIYKYFLFWLWGHDWKHLTSVSQCWICKFSFMHVLQTALVDTAGLILEDRVICLAFCWKDVIILIGFGTHFYCRCIVCTRVAGNEQELWESATFHSKPHEYCVYLNKNYNFFPKYTIWEMGAYLKIMWWVRCTLHQYVPEHSRLWGVFVLCWVQYDIHLKQLRNSEHRELFDVFLTVHHSIELFHQPTLMHNFLYSLTICLLHC